jgi:2-iminobutanoate/2-iminopropanoate deaminase
MYAKKRSVAAAFVLAIPLLASCATAQHTNAPLKKEYFNHSAWTKGIFSEAVTVTGMGSAKMIFLAGVGAEDENGPRGTIRHKGDFVAQCRYAYDKIKRALEAHGAKLSDTVKITTYLTDIRYRIDSGKCLNEQFGSAALPAQTMLHISGLAFPEMMIEVDVTAVAQQ